MFVPEKKDTLCRKNKENRLTMDHSSEIVQEKSGAIS